jgi:hypothetical protein
MIMPAQLEIQSAPIDDTRADENLPFIDDQPAR